MPNIRYIEEAVEATKCIGKGIETHPLSEYIMQSLFLRMTGDQEQKFKCLCWEIATTDYDFRYKIYTQSKLGECSDYKEKKEIYKSIVSILKQYDSSFNFSGADKNHILNELRNDYFSTLDGSILANWDIRNYQESKIIIGKIKDAHFCHQDELLSAKDGIDLCEVYKNHLYRMRNRFAHNLLSYQENLPSLKTLASDDNKYNNYFLHFFILILIDAVIRKLFMKYITIIDDFAF